MVGNFSKKKALKAHNFFAGLVYTKAISYFNVGKNRRKKAFPTDTCLTILLYRSR